MNSFSIECCPNHWSHLARSPISQWYRTSASKWDLQNSMMKFWIVEKFFPMNVAAFIVAAMNILHINECSSPDSATFDILFCLLRTWSFTLFTNSAASLPMIFCCVTAHDECFGICLFLVIQFLRFPRSIMNHLSVPYGMRISFEKRFFTMRWQLVAASPKKFLRFPWSIVLRSSTFPLLRRPRLTIILLWITWWWRFLKFHRSIVTCNRFSRI